MRRTIQYAVPVETGLFTPMQLQPRALTSLWFSAWAQWLRTHFVSFPRLIKAYQTSLVVLGYTVEMEEPFTFYDSDGIDIELDMWVSGGGRFVESTIQYNGGGRPAARGHWVLMPVRIRDMHSLAAEPMPLSADLLACLEPEEVTAEKPQNVLPARLAWIQQQATPIATHTHPFTVRRHHCEVADQWCFAEIPSLAADGREELALAQMDQTDALVAALSSPLARLDVKLTRPLFAFDQAQVQTTAYRRDDESAVYFVHRILSATGGGLEHGIVIEEMRG